MRNRGWPWAAMARETGYGTATIANVVYRGGGRRSSAPIGEFIAETLEAPIEKLFPRGFDHPRHAASTPVNPDETPDNDERYEWVRDQLLQRGWTWSAIKWETGYSSGTISNVIARGGGTRKTERLGTFIAEQLGAPVEELFPRGFRPRGFHVLEPTTSGPVDPDAVPDDGKQRYEWMHEQMRQRGWSWVAVERETGHCFTAIRKVIHRGGGSHRTERLAAFIADKLGAPVDKLFPRGFGGLKPTTSGPVDPDAVPDNDEQRSEWIRDQLRQRGWSLTAVARETGHGTATLASVVSRGGGRRSSAPIGEFIAETLEAPVETLFPAGFGVLKPSTSDPVDPGDIPDDGEQRYKWAHDQLRRRGWSWVAVARATSHDVNTIRKVITRGGGYHQTERLGAFIAEQLGAPVERLFPLGFRPSGAEVLEPYTSGPVDPDAVPVDDKQRYEWMIRELHRRGSSRAAVVRETGHSVPSIKKVIHRGGGTRKTERIGTFIAEKLGVPVETLFPAGFQPQTPRQRKSG